MAEFNALNDTANIQTYAQFVHDAANHGGARVNPEFFYTKQLLDTIRIDKDQFMYLRYADEAPIGEKADKLYIRRWAPLQAHTVPLAEGIPPQSDKGSVEKYELQADSYGRYMEFTDKVDINVVDPVIAHYTKEYSIVAIETLDMLAREALMEVAQKHYAGGAANFEALTFDSVPSIADLRLIVLGLKKALVKPRSNGKFHVIGSPEFYYDLLDDPYVETYMQYNQTTKPMFDGGLAPIPSMFGLEFYETLVVPTSGEYFSTTLKLRRYATANNALSSLDSASGAGTYDVADEHVNDSRTDLPASYIPDHVTWTAGTGYKEFKAQHILILGKDALLRTGLAGEGNAKMYVKGKGSAGVLDPIDQRQSIGFKINSVGFGSTRVEAIVDYICVPTQVNT